MRFLFLAVLLFLNGCAFGRPSAIQGSARFSIPFDFIYPDGEELREDKITEEMDRLEEEMISKRPLLQIE